MLGRKPSSPRTLRRSREGRLDSAAGWLNETSQPNGRGAPDQAGDDGGGLDRGSAVPGLSADWLSRPNCPGDGSEAEARSDSSTGMRHRASAPRREEAELPPASFQAPRRAPPRRPLVAVAHSAAPAAEPTPASTRAASGRMPIPSWSLRRCHHGPQRRRRRQEAKKWMYECINACPTPNPQTLTRFAVFPYLTGCVDFALSLTHRSRNSGDSLRKPPSGQHLKNLENLLDGATARHPQGGV